MTNSMLNSLRKPAVGQNINVSVEASREHAEKTSETHVSVQEEILAELRSVNEILQGIANTMEAMEQNFWT